MKRIENDEVAENVFVEPKSINRNLHIIILSLLVIISISGWAAYYYKQPVITYRGLTLSERTELLGERFLEYQKLTGVELHKLWIDKFHDSKYVLNGKPLLNEYNCSNAIYTFLRSLGSLAVLENAESMGNRLAISAKRRRKLKDIRAGDIVVWKPKGKKDIAHIAIVEGRTFKNGISYMAMGVKTGGINFDSIAFNSKRLRGVYPVTLTFWAGNLLKD